jgi:small subunit ribosomal protein S4
MARYRGPKHKLGCREGVNLTGTTSPSLQRRLRVPSGQARQLVSHGHVLGNERRANIPSYRVRIGDVIHLTARATEIPGVQEELAMAPARLPSWVMREDGIGRVIGEPQGGEMDTDIRTDWIVEFYSR